jgi:hypothetical protein
VSGVLLLSFGVCRQRARTAVPIVVPSTAGPHQDDV